MQAVIGTVSFPETGKSDALVSGLAKTEKEFNRYTDCSVIGLADEVNRDVKDRIIWNGR